VTALAREIAYGAKSLLQGLWITILHFFRPNTTLQYPRERPVLAPRYRGLHGLTAAPDGDLTCIGCGSCAKGCPDQVITMKAEKREGHKGRYPVEFEIDLNSCCFCGLCAEVCPTAPKALVLTKEYEFVASDRAGLVLTREILLENGRLEVEKHGYVGLKEEGAEEAQAA